MRKLIIEVLFILIIAVSSLSPSAQEEVKVKEEVSVVNIEVPVRVFAKGEAVDHLKKTDFKLYEDKKPQNIHGFYKIKRKIRVQEPEPAAEEDSRAELSARYFVLVFRITDYNQDLKKGLDYIFKNILKRDDQLLVFVNDSTLFLNNLADKENTQAVIDQVLRSQGLESRQLLTNYLYKIKGLLERTKIELNADDTSSGLIDPQQAYALLEFLNKYLLTWKEYKNRYLVPDMDKYYNFAQFLEKIRLEKWVISFYQVELFPNLQLSGEFRRKIDRSLSSWLQERSEDVAFARKIMSLLHTLDRELSSAENFPAEEISKLFYKVGATFHSILMTVHKETNVRDLEYKSLSTDIENSLREITAKTGGELMATNNLESALDRLVEKEDIVYMLTYAPENPRKTGKIKVELSDNNLDYKVIYDRNMREDYIREYLERKRAEAPAVQLQEVAFKDKKLSMTITDFLMKTMGKKNTGRLSVHIHIKDSRNDTVYDEQKNIEAEKQMVSLSLEFSRLKKESYHIMIDVKDLLTGKIASQLLQPEIQ